MVARALRLRQRLAVRIRAGETAEVAALAKALAGDEKARHRFVAAHRDRRWRLSSCWRIGGATLLGLRLLSPHGTKPLNTKRLHSSNSRLTVILETAAR